MVGGKVDHIYRRDLYSAARSTRRNCLITIWCGSVSGSGDAYENPYESHSYSRRLPALFEFLHVDIQSTGHKLSRPWSRQPNDVMSETECAQLHSELFRRRHSTRQSHGLFALAKHLLRIPWLEWCYCDGDVWVSMHRDAERNKPTTAHSLCWYDGV